MADKRIEYQVKVDAGDANRKLREFGRAAERAGKDAEQAFDDTSSAADRAAAAIVDMGNKIDTEIRAAADAADALAQALGPELAGKIDLDQTVTDLERMGLTMDDIKGSADKLAGAIKEVDAQTTGRLNEGLAATRAKTDEVTDSSRGAKSALANMIGNTAQDLSGLNSSMGVAIGQMAEYASDAALAGESLGSVAAGMGAMLGPIAVLSLAVPAMQALMKVFGDDNKAAQNIEGLTETLEANIGAFEDWKSAVTSAFDEGTASSEEFLSVAILESPMFDAKRIGEVRAAMGAWGGQIGDLGLMFRNMATYQDESTLGLGKWILAQVEAKGITGDTAEQLAEMIESGNQWSDIQGLLTGTTQNLTDEQQNQVRGLTDLVAIYKELGSAEGFDKVATDTLNANAAIEGHTELVNQARDATDNEVDALFLYLDGLQATDRMMKVLADTQDAYKENIDKAAEATKAALAELQRIKDTFEEFHRVLDSADWGAAGAQAAATVWGKVVDEQFAHANNVDAVLDSYDALGESLAAAGEAGLTFNESLFQLDSPEARNVQDSLQQLAQSYLPAIQHAYDNADGDQAKFEANMADLADRTIRRLIDQLGLSEDQARDVATQLGLMPDDVATTYQLIGDEEALVQLGLLQGVIDDLPKDVQAKIAYQIQMGDWQGAVATAVQGAQSYAEGRPATIPVDADTSAAYAAINNFVAFVRGLNLVISAASSVAGRSSSSSGRSAAPSAASSGLTTYASPVRVEVINPTRLPTPSITVQAGVIGNRYDIVRAVAKAQRQYERLNGRRSA